LAAEAAFRYLQEAFSSEVDAGSRPENAPKRDQALALRGLEVQSSIASEIQL
jgi:hypothetical protein